DRARHAGEVEVALDDDRLVFAGSRREQRRAVRSRCAGCQAPAVAAIEAYAGAAERRARRLIADPGEQLPGSALDDHGEVGDVDDHPGVLPAAAADEEIDAGGKGRKVGLLAAIDILLRGIGALAARGQRHVPFTDRPAAGL